MKHYRRIRKYIRNCNCNKRIEIRVLNFSKIQEIFKNVNEMEIKLQQITKVMTFMGVGEGGL